MAESGTVGVRVFGRLDALRRERGLPARADVEVPSAGVAAGEIAAHLGLPEDLIEGVFCNHVIHGLDHVVHPGDEIAFVPHGTPGPHRVFLGLYRAGHPED